MMKQISFIWENGGQYYKEEYTSNQAIARGQNTLWSTLSQPEQNVADADASSCSLVLTASSVLLQEKF
ncbi:MAG: hypothetical protein RTU30_07690 [Candidatus Thorarchaeota archaeon]